MITSRSLSCFTCHGDKPPTLYPYYNYKSWQVQRSRKVAQVKPPNVVPMGRFFQSLFGDPNKNEKDVTPPAPVAAPVALPSWNFAAAEIMQQIVPMSSSISTCSDIESSSEEEDVVVPCAVEEIGYRTADAVTVVRVPHLKKSGRFKLMVEKQSVFNTKEEGMDTFKYAAALNEWETYSQNRDALRSSPNLVRLHGFTKKKDVIHIYSEYCAGGDLQGLLAAHQIASPGVGMTDQVVQQVALDVLTGLDALHSVGLVHGDVKPANVFLCTSSSPRGTFKVGDYGTMRKRGRKELHYFVAGFGYTPEYTCPETLDHGTANASFSSDLWSFGIMLYELSTGRLPDVAVLFKELHGKEDANAPRTRRSFLRTTPPHESIRGGPQMDDVCPMLKDVLVACLHAKPEARPQSAAQLLEFPYFRAAWRAKEAAEADALAAAAAAVAAATEATAAAAAVATVTAVTAAAAAAAVAVEQMQSASSPLPVPVPIPVSKKVLV
mmetsp:Transcript_35547/g.78884  ORF Transcript_35547/g.78884 Transcript_35547/m.78884 type:complete len:493 (+) Transcript_35547:336-1814(+)|eukprot:CAMPEP_0202905510 /NCGR_PEP_ID=MMETSP1392-20130828/34590_1 /ASSEMBLY_ACC=CAM_ASM_000868 /TAXON_ID=225041 /ORGANISM="Chlamydomonas chlamydogama, Strain SAG 11-48b" /LENGTH=492 /DNA_ID=CAMNT_0049593617 /DNA_START=294 /DNA_END=1772 /DNA_ORIENTATION=+